jgi:uncharacterized membrane-anchored protein
MEAHELEAHLHMMHEDFEAATRSFERLLSRQTHDPLAASRAFMKAVAHYCAGDYAEAARQALWGADMRPNDRMFHVLAHMAFAADGTEDKARLHEERAHNLPTTPTVCGRAPILPPSQRPLADALHKAYREGN